jgi:hypothetical protein
VRRDTSAAPAPSPPKGGAGHNGPVASGVPLPNPTDIRKRYGPQAWPWYLETGERQQWRCGICHRPPRRSEPLAVDHDHDTLILDGLVHPQGCNRLLKQPVRRYLANPPGRQAGIVRVPPEREQRAIDKREREKQAARDKRAAAKTTTTTDPADDLVTAALQEVR